MVDASIMPTLPAAPPNLTIIMLAERCVAALRARLDGSRGATRPSVIA